MVHPAEIQWHTHHTFHASLFGGNHTHMGSHFDGPQMRSCVQESTVTLRDFHASHSHLAMPWAVSPTTLH